MTDPTTLQQHEAERSPHWPHVRDDFVRRNPVCAVCGKGKADGVSLQAHHIFPFHYCIALGRPDLELDERNLITLCETGQGHAADNHHLLVGHLDDFESSNLKVAQDAKGTYAGWAADRIRSDAGWQAQKAHRLPHLPDMDAAQKAAFVWKMNTVYPDPQHPPGPPPAVLPPWMPD